MSGPAPDSPAAPASELAAFADTSGGLAFTGGADVQRRLSRVRADFDGYYSLAFRSPPRRPGTRLDIKVRVRRAGVRVRHREAIRTRTEREEGENAAMGALLAEKSPPNPWGLEVGVGAIRKVRAGSAYGAKVEVRVPLRHMTFVEQDGKHAGRLRFHFATRDAQGKYRQLDSRELPLTIPSDDFSRARDQSIRYGVELILPAGANDLSVTVADATAPGRSTVRAPILAGVRR